MRHPGVSCHPERQRGILLNLIAASPATSTPQKVPPCVAALLRAGSGAPRDDTFPLMIDDATPRPLPVLRAMVDVLDRDLLQIVARRMAIVGEIAAYKRQHGLRIRDSARERELLADRCERAEALGLPSGEMESVFRVLLRAGRDHQASLRAELPYETQTRTVAVIG